MSTPALIIVKIETGLFGSEHIGKYAGSLVNFDGGLDNVGITLHRHYTTQEKVERTISLGDLSCLRRSSDCPEGHTYNTPVYGYSIAYCRDRGEDWEDVSPEYDDSLRALRDRYSYDYAYLFEDGIWYQLQGPVRKPLSELIVRADDQTLDPVPVCIGCDEPVEACQCNTIDEEGKHVS